MTALPDTDTRCSECNRYLMNAIWARGDMRGAKRRLIRSGDAAIADIVRSCKAVVEEAEAALHDHLERVHPDGIVKEAKPARVTKAAAPDDKVRCPVCRRRLKPLGLRFRRHRDESGSPCSNVALPDAEPLMLLAVPDIRPAHHDAKKGECRECGKWLPGERSLCGRCSVKAAS